jgi:DNA-binding SARP family transcriptional activator/WD40 repeat protein
MQIRVLGPLEATVDDRPVAVGGAKQRAVLAMLGLEANRPVTAERLIQGLWGEEPPPSAAKMVQNYVLRLRKVLAADGDAEIVTHGRAYELRIDREAVDACRLERLVAEAAREADAKRPEGAAREALALFRGEPLIDIAHEPFAGPEIRRLEELRLTAAELAIDAELAAGEDHRIIAEVDALLAENPLREHLHAQRMLALYRTGRQAEALEAYREARRTLVDEVGIEPSPELRALHAAILRQEPARVVERERPELPPELDAAAGPPLIGRDQELRRLRVHWRRGHGLITVAGDFGMGKTRLAAELAGEAHAEGAAVAYVAGTGSEESALATFARLRAAPGPALVVLDDADRTAAAVRAAALELVRAHTGVVVCACGQEPAALARLEPDESLRLGGLDALGVRAIAGLYASSGTPVPVDALLSASRGIPGRVHEAAGEWARREATRRVDRAASEMAGERSRARALEAELADSVAELQTARERTAHDGAPRAMTCPYKGLATFGVDDAAYFFGRERLVAELVAHVVGAPLLAVVGPSGSGKSSVVRAGLVPALAGGVLPGSETWTQAIIRPGAHPVAELRRAMRKLEREWRGVLVVDQFEELFTACEDEAERASFVTGLVRWALERDSGATVIAVRADFYGRCAAYPDLSSLLGANHVLVGPMTRDELARAIELPAQRVGLGVEPELAEALLADVEGRPGALPLLSTALLELWRERDGRRLRLAAYARSGGVQGAVARLAEDAYLALGPEQQPAARSLFLRLTGEDVHGVRVRRRVDLGEVDPDLVGRLADRRLLTVDEGTVEVAHEALLREWPRLQRWLDEDVQGRRLHRRLGAAARAAEAGDGDLYRGAQLAAACEWAASHAGELNAGEHAFLDASRRASTRAQRRLRAVLAGVAALLILALIAGGVALDQRSRARGQATAAAAESLGARALADADLDTSLLLARQGVALRDSPRTRSNLLAALLKSPAAVGVLHGPGKRLTSLALSPDDRTLAYTDSEGWLRFVDVRTRRAAAPDVFVPIAGPGPFGDAPRFSPDGALVAVGAQIVDAHAGRRVATLEPPGDGDIFVGQPRFDPDGRTVLAMVYNQTGTIGLQRYDARGGRLFGSGRLLGRSLNAMDPAAPAGPVLTVSAAGRVLTTQSGLVRLRDQDTGQLLRAGSAGLTLIRDPRTLRVVKHVSAGADQSALSPDGRTLLLGDRDGSVRFLDLDTGRVRRGAGRHAGGVVAAAFSANGHAAVTAGEDNRAIVWNVTEAAAVETLAGHTGGVTGLALSRDGRTLYSASLDGRILVWDLAGTHRLGRPFSIRRPGVVQGTYVSTRLLGLPLAYALSPDGARLAIGSEDGNLTVVDARSLRSGPRTRPFANQAIGGLAYAPHGGPLVVGGTDGALALIDPRRGVVVQRRFDQHGGQTAPSFNADGSRMLTLSVAEEIGLWTLRDGRLTGRPRQYRPTYGARSASLSPDGRMLAVASDVGVEIIDARTLKPLARLAGTDGKMLVAAFSPDGRSIVAAGEEGWARLWSAKDFSATTRPLGRHAGAVIHASVSPDGTTLATSGTDGTVQLFDVRTQQPIGAPFPAVPNAPVSAVFSPDGAYLFAVTGTARAFRWDVRPASWERHACAVAGRTLTRAEWDDALPGRPYAPACR